MSLFGYTICHSPINKLKKSMKRLTDGKLANTNLTKMPLLYSWVKIVDQFII